MVAIVQNPRELERRRKEALMGRAEQNILGGLTRIDQQNQREAALLRQEQLAEQELNAQVLAGSGLRSEVSPTQAKEFIKTGRGVEGVFEKRQKKIAEDELFKRGVKERELKIKEGASRKKAGGLNLTPGEKKLDEAFAKDNNDWKAQGGFATIKRNLDSARGVVQELRGSGSLTGPIAGLLAGTKAQNIINPRAAAVQDRINRIIMGSLRQTLGAQFTEKEGQRVLQATFNPNQSEEENIARIESLIDELENTARAKDAASQHFGEFGTLKGFEGINTSQPAQAIAQTPPGQASPEQFTLGTSIGIQDAQAAEVIPLNPQEMTRLQELRLKAQRGQ